MATPLAADPTGAASQPEDRGAAGTPSTLPHGIRIRRAGATGTLVEVDEPLLVHHVASWLSKGPFRPAIEDIVPASQTVLVIAQTDIRGAIVRHLHDMPNTGGRPEDPSRTVTIPVVYDGPDLAAVCDALGLSRQQFVDAHISTEFIVSFFGFAPGFPYLAAMPQNLRLPRRTTPRTVVPQGSVAVAGEYTVVYPGGTPGGLNLIASTTAEPLWDTTRDPPNRLKVGDRVVFAERP